MRPRINTEPHKTQKAFKNADLAKKLLYQMCQFQETKHFIEESTDFSSWVGSKNLLNSFSSCQKIPDHEPNELNFQPEYNKSRKRVLSINLIKLQKQLECYKKIAQAAQIENENLRQQNQYLINKVRFFYKKENRTKKQSKQSEKQMMYRELYEQALDQIQKLKKQKYVYRSQSKQIKDIALKKIKKLQDDFHYIVKQPNNKSSQVKYNKMCKSVYCDNQQEKNGMN